MTIIEKIRQLINDDLTKGLSKAAIHKKTGVSRSSIVSYLDQDIIPDTSTLNKFIRAYNLPKNYFTEGILPVHTAQEKIEPYTGREKESEALAMIARIFDRMLQLEKRLSDLEKKRSSPVTPCKAVTNTKKEAI